MNVVLRCGCGGIQTHVEKSMGLLKLAPANETYIGKEKIRKFASSLALGSNARNYIDAIAKRSGRYAYYMALNSDGDVTALYNLVTGKKTY